MRDTATPERGPTLTWLLTASLLLLSIAATSACTEDASPTPIPTAAPEATSGLLATLKQLPASFKDQGIWYGDAGRALELKGVVPPTSLDELMAWSETDRDAYSEALQGTTLAPGFLMKVNSEPDWERVFGFNGFGVSVALSTGPVSTGGGPKTAAFLKGNFDAEEIRLRLKELEYQEIEAYGETYYTIRDDYQWPSFTSPAMFALGSMNRVFVEDDVLIAAPATDMVTDILAAWAGEQSSLSEDTAFSSLAAALGDPLSAALLTRDTALNFEASGVSSEGQANILSDYQRPSDWGVIHEWEALGIGFGRDDDARWLVISLFYSDPDAAEADAQELLQRMDGYSTVATELSDRNAWLEFPIDTSCSRLTSDAQRHDDGSTLSIQCALTEDAVSWVLLMELRDLGFLLP